ncbi:MAG: hypothetical protein LAO31_15105 [Acidobacteriia bacterium]|nr:hypothetical protein [Terriglobia bacterium]
MNRWLAILAFFCVVIPLPAQMTSDSIPLQNPAGTQEAQTVRELLSSPELKNQAWAAYLAQKYSLVEFVPQLRNLLRPVSSEATIRSRTETEQWYLNRIVLGALIQLDASLTSNDLMPYYEAFPNEAIILMARSPKAHEMALLSMIRKEMTQDRWLAACNLLANSRTPGFAAQLLREIKIIVNVTVVDPNRGPGVGAGSASGGIGCGAYWDPPGFPPWFQYDFTTLPQRGDVVVAPGPHTVYYRRQIGWGSSDSTKVDRDPYRREYLAYLLGRELSSFTFNPRAYHTVQWKGPEDFTREVTLLWEGKKSMFQKLVHDLRESNLLSDEEVESLRPNISLQVHDSREDQSIPLEIPEFN